jgi:hypothetical protein
MALFMLVGQFAFFHLHVHIDQENHQKTSVKLTAKQNNQQIVGFMLSETSDNHNRHCEVCDLYLSKKLDVVKQYKFSFNNIKQDIFVIAPFTFTTVQKVYLQLRAPPVTHAC